MNSFLERLRYLLPGRRAAEEREMREEFEALKALADPRELGNLTLAAENARAVWGWAWLGSLIGDVRYAFRVLARERSFTTVAVLSLGLGIGANAAIYSLIDRVLWRQLPVADPDRLVTTEDSISTFAFDRYRQAAADALAGVALTSSPMERDVDERTARVELVSGNYFEMLGVGAQAGRVLTPDDDRRANPAPVAVLSYRYWQRAYGGRPVLGQTTRITKLPFTIVGVAPEEFFGVSVGDAADLWVPLSTLPSVLPGRRWLDDPRTNYARLLGRLRPGVSLERAAAILTPISVQIDLDRAPGDIPDWIRKMVLAQKVTLKPLVTGLSSLRNRFSKPLHVLFAMVGLGLLLACINVMSLQFARADERRRELGVRLAIGAGRGRLIRQLLTEALVLALAGGALGLALCRPAAAAVVALISVRGEPVRLDLAIDWRILGFVAAVSAAAALVCGWIPAVRATGQAAAGGLYQNSRGTTAAPSGRLVGRTVAAIQLGLSVVLIAGAFLFAFSLRGLTHFPTGLERERLVVLDIDPKEGGYPPAQLAALTGRLLDRVRALPGVEAASFSHNGIYSGRNSNTEVITDGFTGTPGPQRLADYDNVGPGYFTTLGTRLLAGRDFNDRDTGSAPKVTVVSAEFVRHFFPDGNPMGRNVYFGKDREAYQVVGIAEDIRTDVRRRPRRSFYVAEAQQPYDYYTIRYLLRTSADPGPVMSRLRGVVRAEDPALRVESIETADQLLNRTLDLDRLIAALSFAFGVLAVTLAAVGVYGMLAYDVARRTPEIGIRMALGATRTSVLALVFREVVWVGTAGIALGLAGALTLGRLVKGLVFELKPGDPRVLAAAIGLLALVAIAAALAPARRAATMDPMRALRTE